MDAAIKIALVIALGIVAVLPLVFGGETMPGTMQSGEMMGNSSMGAIGWMWIPTIFLLGLGGVLAWVLFGSQK